MLLSWFDAKEAISFGNEIVKDVNKLFPPKEHKGKAIPVKVYKKKFDRLLVRLRDFSIKQNLNLYQKAKLLNTLKWGMKDSGHEEAAIQEFITLVSPLLNASKGQKNKRLNPN